MRTIRTEEGYPLALRDTYLAMIRGSVGSNQYRKLYIKRPDGICDVIGDGDLACAYFISSILTLCRLLKGGVHTTVTSTINDLVASGWKEAQDFKEGSVVVWGPKLCTDGLLHRHIGFYIGEEKAVSNVARVRKPAIHHITYNDTREIEKIYFHDKLK
jgi:hypothetical protein